MKLRRKGIAREQGDARYRLTKLVVSPGGGEESAVEGGNRRRRRGERGRASQPAIVEPLMSVAASLVV